MIHFKSHSRSVTFIKIAFFFLKKIFPWLLEYWRRHRFYISWPHSAICWVNSKAKCNIIIIAFGDWFSIWWSGSMQTATTIRTTCCCCPLCIKKNVGVSFSLIFILWKSAFAVFGLMDNGGPLINWYYNAKVQRSEPNGNSAHTKKIHPIVIHPRLQRSHLLQIKTMRLLFQNLFFPN